MRAVDCPCGEALEARNDSELFEAAKRHASEEHGDQYSDAALKLLVDTRAYDAAGVPAGRSASPDEVKLRGRLLDQ